MLNFIAVHKNAVTTEAVQYGSRSASATWMDMILVKRCKGDLFHTVDCGVKFCSPMLNVCQSHILKCENWWKEGEHIFLHCFDTVGCVASGVPPAVSVSFVRDLRGTWPKLE